MDSLSSCCLQGSQMVHKTYNGLTIVQCVVPGTTSSSWYIRMPWIFILIALCAAACLSIVAW